MRTISFYLLILFFALVGKIEMNAQNLEWAKSFGNTSTERITCSTTDGFGNVYVTGFFTGTVDFDPSVAAYNLTSSGSTDGFVARYGPSGNLLWANAIGGVGTDRATAVSVSIGGTVLVGGYFSGTATIAGSTRTATGTNDGFLVDYDTNGVVGDVSFIGGTGRAEISGVVSKDNFIAVTGLFTLAADFSGVDGTLPTLNAVGGTDIFVLGFEFTGTKWVQSYGGALDESPRAIVADAFNNTYAVGGFQGSADFNPTSGVDIRNSNGNYDCYLIKNSATGILDWAHTFGGSGFDRIADAVIDNSNNVRVVGVFTDVVNMNPNPTTPVIVTSQGLGDVFVSTFLNNRLLLWNKTFGGAGTDDVTGLSRDGANNLYIGGSFSGTADFDPSASTENRISNGNNDAYICKLDGTGNYVWAHNIGAANFDYAFDVATTSAGMVYLVGTFQNTVDFDPGSANVDLVSNGGDDCFIAKFGLSPVITTPPAPPATLDITKRITNIRPSATFGNQIVAYEIDVKNNNAVAYSNLRMTDVFSANTFSAVVGVVGTPKITFATAPVFNLNPNWNGTTSTQLLDISKNNTLAVGQLIRIAYEVEVNRTALSNASTYTNTVTITSTSSPITGTASLNLSLPITIKVPTDMESDISTGQPKVLYPQWLLSFGGAVVLPHPQCGNMKWTYYCDIRPFTKNCGQTGVRHTLFRGTDACGNIYDYYADFKIIDKVAPIFDVLPKDLAIDCSDKNAAATLISWLSSAGNAKIVEPGDEGLIYAPTVSHDFDNSSMSCLSGSKLVKFTLTDGCNNKSTASASLAIVDNAPPTFTFVPSDITLKCGTNYTFGTAQAADDCSTVTLTFVDTKSPAPCNTGSVDIRTWTATDICGNTATASQKVVFEDLTVSTIVMTMTNDIADKSITCSQSLDFDVPNIVSNCPKGIVTSSYKDATVAGNCAKEYSVVRTWTFQDECSNTYEVKQNITVADKTPPIFDSKLNTYFVMSKSVFNAWQKTFLQQVKATDECSIVTHTAPTVKAISPFMVNCKIVATDECGNASTYNCNVKLVNSTTAITKTQSNDTQTAESTEALQDFINNSENIEVTAEPVVYPNPTSKMVNIIPAKGYGDIQKIHLYNVNGQNVLNLDVEGMQNQTISIDISSLQNAIYLIEMEHTDKKVYKKVSKN